MDEYDDVAVKLLNLGRLAATRLDSEGLRRFRDRIEDAKAHVGAYPY